MTTNWGSAGSSKSSSSVWRDLELTKRAKNTSMGRRYTALAKRCRLYIDLQGRLGIMSNDEKDFKAVFDSLSVAWCLISVIETKMLQLYSKHNLRDIPAIEKSFKATLKSVDMCLKFVSEYVERLGTP